MNLKIGIKDFPQPLEIELGGSADASVVKKEIDAALSGKKKTISFSDDKGKEVFIISESVSFIELNDDDPDRRIGFG